MGYVEAKARVIRDTDQIFSFIAVMGDYKAVLQNAHKDVKIEQLQGNMWNREKVESDIKFMEAAVSQNIVPIDTKYSRAFFSKFDSLYYELAAFKDVHKISISLACDHSLSSFVNYTTNVGNISHYQLP